MTKYLNSVLIALSVAAFIAWEWYKTPTEIEQFCIDGVFYLQFPAGAVTPQWTPEGKVRGCEAEYVIVPGPTN